LTNPYISLIILKLENIFLNFLTEFFYEKFLEFFSVSTTKPTKKFKQIKFLQGQLYKNLSSENLSISYFSFLQKNIFCSKKYFDKKKLIFILVEFEKFLLNFNNLNLFYKNLINFWSTNETFQQLESLILTKYNSYEINSTLLLGLTSILQKYLLE